MPIKPDLRNMVPPEKGGFSGRRKRDNVYDYRQYNESPQTQKTDREQQAKGDRQRIFDTRGFKDAIDQVQKEFGSRINPGVKSKVKRP